MSSEEEKIQKWLREREEPKSKASVTGFLGTAIHDEIRKKRAKKRKDLEFEESIDEILETQGEQEQKINELLDMMLEKGKLDIDLKKEILGVVDRFQKAYAEFMKKEAKRINVLKKAYVAKTKALDKELKKYDKLLEKEQQQIFEWKSSHTQLRQSITIYEIEQKKAIELQREYNKLITELNKDTQKGNTL